MEGDFAYPARGFLPGGHTPALRAPPLKRGLSGGILSNGIVTLDVRITAVNPLLRGVSRRMRDGVCRLNLAGCPVKTRIAAARQSPADCGAVQAV